MLLQQLLRRIVPPDDAVLGNYVETVLPLLIVEGVVRTAKGGEKYLHKHDQSMLAHILNGLLPTWHVARETAGRGGTVLTDQEARLFMAAYTLHDLNKLVAGEGKAPSATEEQREERREELNRWVKQLHIDRFLPEWEQYRDDLLFLVLNTQKRYDTNRNVAAFHFNPALPSRRRERLREMCTFADTLVSSVFAPADAVLGQTALGQSLNVISDGLLGLRFHKLAEVRGILTNMISNEAMHQLAEHGYQPFLIFPNGVVYLVDARAPTVELDREALSASVRQAVVGRLKAPGRDDLIGFIRDGKGLKIANYYYTFFSLEELLQMGIKGTFARIADSKTPVTAARLQAAAMLRPGLPIEGLPNDLRTDRLGEYLGFLERQVIGELYPKDGGFAVVALRALGLESLSEEARIQSGGVPLGWYYIAARYVGLHPGLDSDGLEEVMAVVAKAILQHYGPRLPAPHLSELDVLEPYVGEIVSTGEHSEDNIGRFAAELRRYGESKRKPICSLCSSPYTAKEQEEAAILFAPQVYSNKLPLNSSKALRCICPICSLEMMLRQVWMRGSTNVGGRHYEALKVKYVYLYPSYFFTQETFAVARDMVEQLRDLNMFTVKRHMDRQGTTVEAVLTFEEFTLFDEEESQAKSFIKPSIAADEHASLLFFGLRALDQSPSDTEAWALPGLLALILPVIFNAKVVISDDLMPIYASGADLHETVVIDTPHTFLLHLLAGKDRLRLHELESRLLTVLSIYLMHLEVHAEGGKPQWNRLNCIARDLATDPLYVFHYLSMLARKAKGEAVTATARMRCWDVYERLRGGSSDMIAQLVNDYAKFYRASGFAAHAILRPLDIAAQVVVNSDAALQPDDLQLEVEGEINNFMGRVHSGHAEGRWLLTGEDERQAVEQFAKRFLHDVFNAYCSGERAILRERLNRLKAGCETYYLKTYVRKASESDQGQDGAVEVAEDSAVPVAE